MNERIMFYVKVMRSKPCGIGGSLNPPSYRTIAGCSFWDSEPIEGIGIIRIYVAGDLPLEDQKAEIEIAVKQYALSLLSEFVRKQRGSGYERAEGQQ